MAEPYESDVPLPQIAGDNLTPTGWVAPPGWYGFIAAAGPGIISRAGLPVDDVSVQALIDLGSPDPYSRSTKHDGRRLVRIAGGFIALNYDEFRSRDYSAADRSRRYREKLASRRDVTVKRDAYRDVVTKTRRVTRDITQAEAEAEVQEEKKGEGKGS